MSGKVYIELEDFLSPERIERAYGKGVEWQHQRSQFHADRALEWARRREPRLLKGLDIMANHLHAKQVDQGLVEKGGLKVEYTEYQLVKNAYICADRGLSDMGHYAWIYAGAAWAVGLFPG